MRTLENRIVLSSQKTAYLVRQLRDHFGDAWVTGYEPLIEQMANHPKNRHVLAAAVKCGACTSPLIALEFLGDLEFVPRILSGTIIIPPAVFSELGGRGLPDWLSLRALTQPIDGRIAGASLGNGETEALSLSLEVSAKYVLLDDRAARRFAMSLQIKVLGTLGLLVRAKRSGLVGAIRPKLDTLRALPFHIASALYRDVLLCFAFSR